MVSFTIKHTVGAGVIRIPQCAWLLKYSCGTIVAIQPAFDFISYIATDCNNVRQGESLANFRNHHN